MKYYEAEGGLLSFSEVNNLSTVGSRNNGKYSTNIQNNPVDVQACSKI